MTDRQLATAQAALAAGARPEIITRSGLSRVGVHATPGPRGLKVANGRVQGDTLVTSTLPDHHGGANLLRIFRELCQTDHAPSLGRVLLRGPDWHYSRAEVEALVETSGVRLPEGSTIHEDGTVEIPMTNRYYEFNPFAFTDDIVRLVWRRGKHALDDLQALSKRDRTGVIPARALEIGAMQLSLGGVIAILDEAVADGVIHLGARVLDGMKTSGFVDPITGLGIYRQLELLNTTDEPKEVKSVRVRLYPGSQQVRELSSQVTHSPGFHEHGFEFRDILGRHGGVVADLVNSTIGSPDRPERGPLRNGAVFLAGERMARLERGPEILGRHYKTNEVLTAQAVVAAETNGIHVGTLRGEQVPLAVRPLLRELDYIGGEQNAGKVMCVGALPTPDQLDKLVASGIRVFAFRYFGKKLDNPYMTARMHSQLRKLHASGVQFAWFAPTSNGDQREWKLFDKHGTWTRPQDKERVDAVDTVIALYGSAVDQAVDPLTGHMDGFMRLAKDHFDDAIAVIHGSGPGVMLLADQMAAQHGVVSLGIGIGAETLGQQGNMRPEAVVAFGTQDRLHRQDMIDAVSTFQVFWNGGSGTLEEIAISACSQKLSLGIPTPMFFLDPFGLGDGGQNQWIPVHEQLRVLSREGMARRGYPNATELEELGMMDINFLAPFISEFAHVIDTPEEAIRTIIGFTKDPIAYYEAVINRTIAVQGVTYSDDEKKRLKRDLFLLIAKGYLGELERSEDTGFNPPSWFPASIVTDLYTRWDVELDPENKKHKSVVAWLETQRD